MREDDRGATKQGGIGDDSAQREVDPPSVALMAGKVNASRMLIEMRDPKMFPAGLLFGQTARKEEASAGEAV